MLVNFKKHIIIKALSILNLIIFTGCVSQSPQPSEPPVILLTAIEDRISEYLPITAHDQFVLVYGASSPFTSLEKTDFTESELMIIHNAINNLQLYGYNSPLSNDKRFALIGGVFPYFYATNEYHVTMFRFISYGELGFFVTAIIDGEPESIMWFKIDSEVVEKVEGIYPDSQESAFN